MLFGINQGAIYADIRIEHAKRIREMDLDGFAVGGLAVGETHEEMYYVLDETVPYLPADKPTYLMGVGTPKQIVESVARGIDMFDCVLPTRLGRHGGAYVGNGETISIKAGRYAKDLSPIEEGCQCYACKNFSRSYIRHLLNVGEILGMRLLTLHNLHYYLNLAKRIRTAIENDTFAQLRMEFKC